MRIAFILLFFTTALFSKITDYKVISDVYAVKGQEYLAIRSFKQDGVGMYLAYDLKTHATFLIKQEGIEIRSRRSNYIYPKYLKNKIEETKNQLQNSGLTKSLQGEEKGIFLSVDLCPSSKEGFEEDFFLGLREYGKKIPVAICISGKWILAHKEEFARLKQWEKEGWLDITWVNHSYSHYYDPFAKLEDNFMRKKGDVDKEIEKNEILLLENGVVPSVFFRFPGLVSSPTLIENLKKHNLIPLGAGAWVAKGEVIRDGDVVLLHGNKNEPQGIAMFERYLKKQRVNFLDIKNLY